LIWLGLVLWFGPLVLVVALMTVTQIYLRHHYLPNLIRIFQEKPLFIIPRGEPIAAAEDVRFPTGGGLHLRGCYLRTVGPRKGVILFGLEFGSNRWACAAYCDALTTAGYDVFAFEPRGQGESDKDPNYSPLQWLTERDVEDTRAALAYLKRRRDADPRGVGLFGISKGGSAGLLAAADDNSIRCFVTDGAYATYSTMVPYMRKWVAIYNQRYMLQGLLPPWYYGMIAMAGMRKVGRQRGVEYLHVETAMSRLGARPLLMIHGSADTYIKPQMAEMLCARVRGPKELWLIDKAKHNQALQVAGAEYHKRVIDFFDRNLGGLTSTPDSADLGPTPIPSKSGKPAAVGSR
jgi:pimeloyl-ACP methyl ester carboxylesterase